MNPPLPTSRPRPSVALYSSKMLRVRSPAPQEERSIREVAQGSVIICFTWTCLVEMRSEKWPEGTPTTVHVYDMEIENDPAMHPVNGMQEFSQVYRGWYYRGPSRDGEPCAGDLAIKWARGPGRIRELEREHRNYVEMANMQGEIIPYMYDFLRANVDGVEVACLVLQWCNGKVPTDRRLFVCVLPPLGSVWSVR